MESINHLVLRESDEHGLLELLVRDDYGNVVTQLTRQSPGQVIELALWLLTHASTAQHEYAYDSNDPAFSERWEIGRQLAPV